MYPAKWDNWAESLKKLLSWRKPITGTFGPFAQTKIYFETSLMQLLCLKKHSIVVSFFSENFAVKSKVDPSNLAYTPVQLGMHTDLPYYSNPPGVSFPFQV